MTGQRSGRPDTSRHGDPTTEDEVQALPVIVDLPTAARVLGLG
jgi:hypothetical protein